MKILFIGGTGTISSAITRQLLQKGEDLYLLNRGNRNDKLSEKAKVILCVSFFKSELCTYHGIVTLFVDALSLECCFPFQSFIETPALQSESRFPTDGLRTVHNTRVP